MFLLVSHVQGRRSSTAFMLLITTTLNSSRPSVAAVVRRSQARLRDRLVVSLAGDVLRLILRRTVSICSSSLSVKLSYPLSSLYRLLDLSTFLRPLFVAGTTFSLFTPLFSLPLKPLNIAFVLGTAIHPSKSFVRPKKKVLIVDVAEVVDPLVYSIARTRSVQ